MTAWEKGEGLSQLVLAGVKCCGAVFLVSVQDFFPDFFNRIANPNLLFLSSLSSQKASAFGVSVCVSLWFGTSGQLDERNEGFD